MIVLHRLGHVEEPFHLNPDLICTVEANPDTVITLTGGAKIVVAEPPERVAALVRTYRIEILAGAMDTRGQRRGNVRPITVARPSAIASAPAPRITG